MFLALGLVAVCLTSAAVIVGVTDHDPTRRRVTVVQQVTPPVQSVLCLSVTPGSKPGADGELHDAYSVTDSCVDVGQPERLVINKTGTVPHGILSPEAGVSITVNHVV